MCIEDGYRAVVGIIEYFSDCQSQIGYEPLKYRSGIKLFQYTGRFLFVRQVNYPWLESYHEPDQRREINLYILFCDLVTRTDGKYLVLPSGELHIRDVGPEDGYKTYQCRTKHRLTGETRLSATKGRLVITGK